MAPRTNTPLILAPAIIEAVPPAELAGDDVRAYALFPTPITLTQRDAEAVARRHGVTPEALHATCRAMAAPDERVIARWDRGVLSWRAMPADEAAELWRHLARQLTTEPVQPARVPALDLRAAYRAARQRGDLVEAYRVHIEGEADTAYALVLPGRGLAAIAWGGEAAWYDAEDLDGLLRAWRDEAWWA